MCPLNQVAAARVEGGGNGSRWMSQIRLAQCRRASEGLTNTALPLTALPSPHAGQQLLVGVHEQLDGLLPDLQRGHVGQEVVTAEEAHEDCGGWGGRVG